MLFLILVVISVLGYVSSAALKDIRPLVIWHGLGDTYDSPGMLQFQSEVKKMHPGIFVHSVYIDQNPKADQRAGFYGKVNDQLDLVAAQFASVPELSRGFDAIGFSQGGQFLRAYVERNNTPPIFNLITFGSQHMGISDLPLCSAYDLLCQIARRAARGGVYSDWAQENLIQAQYFRDPAQLTLYLSASSFLADVNNEVLLPPRNETYAANLATLSNLVLVLFAQDKTVVPKESAWFGSEAPPQDDDAMPFGLGSQVPLTGSELLQSKQEKTIVPMRLQPLYAEDWIGLRTLDERGAVTLATCPGEHMQLTGCWEDLVGKWIGWTFDQV